MIELRTIAGELFVVTSTGKREVLNTPQEAIHQAGQDISRARRGITGLAEAEQEARQRLESHLLEGLDTAAIRRELEAMAQEADGLRQDIADAEQLISEVRNLIDQRAAAAIRSADAARLAAAVAPFDSILKECC